MAGRKRHACHSPPLPVFCPDRPRPLAPGRAAKPLYTLPDRSRLVKQRATAWGHPRVHVSPEHERLSGGAGFFKGRRPLNALLVPFRASEKGPAARGRTPRIPCRRKAASSFKKVRYCTAVHPPPSSGGIRGCKSALSMSACRGARGIHKGVSPYVCFLPCFLHKQKTSRPPGRDRASSAARGTPLKIK